MSSGSQFRVTPASWNQDSREVVLDLSAQFSRSGPAPRLAGVAVDGRYTRCDARLARPVTRPAAAPRAAHPAWPSKVLGLYILLADDAEDGFGSEADWEPELFPWQQEAANVLFFTFIHPDTMEVPPAYQRLAATRGTSQPGAVPANTVIMFAIGKVEIQNP